MATSRAATKEKSDGERRKVARAFTTRLDLAHEKREELQGLLNARLADAVDLYAQTKQAHWNVKGPNFYQLHLLFDDLAETVEGHVDLFAERVTALGGTARGTVRQVAKRSSLPEFPEDLDEDLAFVEALADRFGDYGNNLREAIDRADDLNDKGTADILTEAVREADKALYFLEAHLRGVAAPKA